MLLYLITQLLYMGFRLFPCFFCINQKFGINICFSADMIPNFYNFCLATSAHFRALSPGLLPLTRAPPHILSSDKCALSCAITRTPPAYAGPSSCLVFRLRSSLEILVVASDVLCRRFHRIFAAEASMAVLSSA